eukprot:g36024.t1
MTSLRYFRIAGVMIDISSIIPIHLVNHLHDDSSVVRVGFKGVPHVLVYYLLRRFSCGRLSRYYLPENFRLCFRGMNDGMDGLVEPSQSPDHEAAVETLQMMYFNEEEARPRRIKACLLLGEKRNASRSSTPPVRVARYKIATKTPMKIRGGSVVGPRYPLVEGLSWEVDDAKPERQAFSKADKSDDAKNWKALCAAFCQKATPCKTRAAGDVGAVRAEACSSGQRTRYTCLEVREKGEKRGCRHLQG